MNKPFKWATGESLARWSCTIHRQNYFVLTKLLLIRWAHAALLTRTTA